jgi:hypothetical protein
MSRRPPRCVRAAVAAVSVALTLAASAVDNQDVSASRGGAKASESKEQSRMCMTIGTRRFGVTLESNPTAAAFVQLLPATFNMPDLNGNEKHVRLPSALPVDASRPGTIRAGDVMLDVKDTLVVVYKTFNSAYSYTRIGRIEEGASLEEVLGSGPSRVTFTTQ